MNEKEFLNKYRSVLSSALTTYIERCDEWANEDEHEDHELEENEELIQEAKDAKYYLNSLSRE